MEKDEFIKDISTLPGVGKASAEKLFAAGFTSRDELMEASIEELQDAGLSSKIAEAVHEGLRAEPAEEPAPIEEVEELGEEPAEAEETRIVEEEEYVPKQKPELSDELERALKIRNHQSSNLPKFQRQEWWRYKDLGKKWRKPMGYHSKQRKGWKVRTPLVRVGYRTIKEARGLHPSGFEEVLVHNADDLDGIDPATQAARIGATVGGRKRAVILAKAAEEGIRVLNPGGGRR